MAEPAAGEARSKEPSKKQLKLDSAERLGLSQCPLDEAALILETKEQVLTTGYLTTRYRTGLAKGRQLLREAQFKQAASSATMAIFLGKTYLGQGERQEAVQGSEVDLRPALHRVHEKFRRQIAGVDAEPDC